MALYCVHYLFALFMLASWLGKIRLLYNLFLGFSYTQPPHKFPVYLGVQCFFFGEVLSGGIEQLWSGRWNCRQIQSNVFHFWFYCCSMFEEIATRAKASLDSGHVKLAKGKWVNELKRLAVMSSQRFTCTTLAERGRWKEHGYCRW